jgi:hypothetical protein
MDATYLKNEKKSLEKETKFKNGIGFATYGLQKKFN